MGLGKLKFVEDEGVDEGMEEGIDNDVELEKETIGLKEGGDISLVEGPPKKRVKRDLTKEAEDKLESCKEMLQDPALSNKEKFTEISNYLDYVHENNVNTFEFKEDFAEWCKSTVLTLISDTSSTSVECFSFLCNILKAAPTVIEPICEQILAFIYVQHDPSLDCDLAMQVFMEQLSQTFEKLRRFPKLIAKILRSVKENIEKLITVKQSKKKRNSVVKIRESGELSRFVLPKGFMNSYSSILTMLPAGQIIDLWKTLQYNLEEGCIKPLQSNSSGSSLAAFFTIVVDLTVAYLSSIKVDHSLSTSAVEKVYEVLGKLKDNVLTSLGKIVILKENANLVRTFLKLSMAWAGLHQLMIIYKVTDGQRDSISSDSNQIEEDSQEAVDLSGLLTFLSGSQWITLWKSVVESEDVFNIRLMVKLVSLKLNNMAVSAQRKSELSHGVMYKSGKEKVKMETEKNFKRSMQKAAIFIWNHQHFLEENKEKEECLGESREHILDIASAYMDHEKLIDYAKTFLDNMLLQQQKENMHREQQGLIDNVTFHVALVLESMDEGLKRVVKMNLMKRPVKKFLQECLNSQCKVKILEGLKEGKGFGKELKPFLLQAVEILNDSITEKEKGLKKRGDENENVEPDPGLLKEIIFFLERQELEQYPKAVKTLIFLCCSLIFMAVIGNFEEVKENNKNKDLLESLVCLLSECGRNSQGNDILFQVKWTELFKILMAVNKNDLSERACEGLCLVILENIYVSPKVAKEFEEKHLESIEEDFNFTIESSSSSLSRHLGLFTLNFLVKEIMGKGTNSKLGSLLFSHIKKLTSAAVNKLSDGSIIAELHNLLHSSPSPDSKKSKRGSRKNKDETMKKMSNLLSNPFVSGVMYTCNLLLKAKPHMNTETVSEYKVIVLPYLHFALDFVEVCKVKKTIEEGNIPIVGGENQLSIATATPLFCCLRFLTESLKCFEEFREELGQDFLQRLWDCSLRLSKKDTEMLKLILQVANEEVFQVICDSIHQRMEAEEERIFCAKVLSSLIEAELPNEKKKQIRRITVEHSLYKNLQYLNSWKDSENFIDLAIPYLQFQTALLRRRKPMGNLNALAVSLSSVSAMPFDKIDDVESFKRVYSQVCELLNALTIHRLDVLSFRTHIFLQCFQFLVSSLVRRADQRNKLTDREIYDLRHCAHCIERICQSAKLGKQEFTRAAPYLVVVLLKQFEKITVYPIVKNPLLNGCYKLMDMCDDKGISHVNSMLSVGSREIFKSVYDLYKKFYRYKGKV